MSYYIYILTNNYNSVLYTWVTNNLERRVYEHAMKMIPWFTSKYDIKKLVYFEETDDINGAIAREKQIKWWTRAKKNVLIKSLNPSRKDLLWTNEILH